jgi:hypothetical protein
MKKQKLRAGIAEVRSAPETLRAMQNNSATIQSAATK